MPIIGWSEKISVGVKVLDDDHKRIIDIINKLYGDYEQGCDNDTIGCVIGDLLNYADEHFERAAQPFFCKFAQGDLLLGV